MKCADIDRFLSEGTPLHDMQIRPEVQAHLAHCRRCRNLIAWARTPFPEPPLGSPVEDRIRTLIRADLRPVKPLPSLAKAIASAFLLAFTLIAIHAMAMGLYGWQKLSFLQMVSLAALAAVILVVSVSCLMTSLQPGSNQRIHPALPVLLLLAGFPAWTIWFFPAADTGHFVQEGVPCLAAGLMMAALTAGMTHHLARRGYSTNWPLTGTLIGVVGGLIAVVALQLSCPDQELSHILVWHGLTIVISILGGYWAGLKTRPA